MTKIIIDQDLLASCVHSKSGEILLSTLLGPQMCDRDSSIAMHEISMTIAPGMSICVVDDVFAVCFQSSRLHFIVEKESRLFYRVKIASERNERNQHKSTDVTLESFLTVSCVGPGAEATIRYLCLGHGSNTFRIKTLQHHMASDTKSTLSVKGVFSDQSKLFCENLIRIEKGTKQVQASEENKNMILSREARVISIPKLEVESDDVRCQHGAAVSRIDQQQLFYLQSRGLPSQEAKQLLIDAFLHETST